MCIDKATSKVFMDGQVGIRLEQTSRALVRSPLFLW